MWTLEKPDLKKALDDIKNVIAASNGKLLAGDEPFIKMVYQAYNNNGGTITKSDNYKLCGKQRTSLKNLYRELGKVNRKPGKLSYIRRELMDAVDECPMCGLCSPYELDHQMPKSIYESLAVCRLNLVPVCGRCNNLKNKKDACNFIHPYYTQFPKNVVFLIAKVKVDVGTLRVAWQFEIDGKGLGNKHLEDQINNQVTVIELFDRLRKASVSYLSDKLYGRCFKNDEDLKLFLKIEYEKACYLYKRNHWRTVLMYSLYQNKDFHYQAANNYAIHIKPINKGNGV